MAIVGCGYVGGRLARALVVAGHRVLAGSRDPERLRPRLPYGAVPFRLDLDQGIGTGIVRAAPLVVVAHPPPRSGVTDPRSARLAAALRPCPPRRLLYLSTVGIYGDRGGAWVTETCPPAPATDRSRRRLDAEACWRGFGRATGSVVTLLRVAGIYGPGRLPLEAVRKGEAWRVAWPERRFTNPVHADDLVGLIRAALHRGRPGRAYHACDGQERPQGALQETVAEVLGLGLPEPLDPQHARRTLSEMRLSFLAESRRCCNSRALRELPWTPAYSDLREGVEASLREMGELDPALPGPEEGSEEERARR